MTDIEARDEGSLWTISGKTALGQDWLEANLQEDAMRWAGGFVVAPRYVGPDPDRRVPRRARGAGVSPLDAAGAALEHPADFAYFGDLHEEDGWGRAFGVHRDSDALERSNWQVITEDLRERFPEDFTSEEYSHWLVGWVETGRVRVVRQPELGVSEENLTDAFLAVVEWRERLNSYPVLDESRYSELEWSEFQKWVEAEASYTWTRDHEEEVPETLLGRVLEVLSADYCRPEDISSDALKQAMSEALEEPSA